MPPKKRGRPSTTTTTTPKPTPKSKAPRTSKSTSESISKPTPNAKATPTSKSKSNPKPTTDPTQLRAAFDSYATDSVISIPDTSRALKILKYPLPPPDFFDEEQEEEGLNWGEFRELAETLRSSAQDSESDGSAYDEGEDPQAGSEHDDNDYDGGEVNEQANEEILQAFKLFTQFQPQYPTLQEDSIRNRKITMADLKRIAKELKEEVDEKVLGLMMEEANGLSGQGAVQRGVGLGEFGEVLRRAGAV